MNNTQLKRKRMLPSALWSMAGIALCILLVSAVQRNEKLHCSSLEITIAGFKNEMFISESDVKALIEDELGQKVKGCSLEKIDLRKLENIIQKDKWIKKAQLYIDNSQVLRVNVSERLPVARVFTVANESFYIDSEAIQLPLSTLESADVPVFTNVPDRGKIMTQADSIFWKQLSSIGNYISQDSFLLMQIGQLSVTPEKEFELYPVIGNHVVKFGTPEDYESKFKKLTAFYKQVLAKAGLNKYSVVDLRFNKQVVARLRNKEEINTPYEPQINVQADILAVVPEIEKQAIPAVSNQEVVPTKKKVEEKSAAVAKKEKPKDQTVQKTNRKPAKEKEKIIVASNNKPAKNTIKQLPAKAVKSELVEVDLKRKPQTESASSPKALMPKKQEK